jgi:hypothetical protein
MAPVVPLAPVALFGFCPAHAGGTREIAQFGRIPQELSVFASTS